MPKPVPSISRPMARVKSPLPSASIRTLSPTFCALPQASITKASLTETQAIAWTPFFLSSSAFSTKPGRWRAEQVGVHAPGSANTATFLPLNSSSVEMSFGPSADICFSFADGTLSPTLTVIALSFSINSAVPLSRPAIRRCEGPSLFGQRTQLGVRRAGARDRVEHRLGGQQLGQRDAGGRARAVDRIERNAIAAERGEIIGDRRIGPRPVGA